MNDGFNFSDLYINTPVSEIKNTNEWQPMSSAPKNGITIEVNYGTIEKPDTCLAFWSDRPVCMGGRTVMIDPGWATAGDNVDRNLPLDEPNFWREAI